MHAHEHFLTEESWRYAVECRRMARLAHRPKGGPKARVGLWTGLAGRLQNAEAFNQIRALFVGPPQRRTQYAVRPRRY
jgi:hypothetical protein